MSITQVILGVYLLINIVAFLLVALDKRRSVQGRQTERTPEGLLFFIAAVFGGVGVYSGMLFFRHKTRRWYFQLGIPLLILQNIAMLYLLRDILSN